MPSQAPNHRQRAENWLEEGPCSPSPWWEMLIIITITLTKSILWYSALQRGGTNSAPLECELDLVTLLKTRLWQKWRCVTAKTRSQKALWLPPFSLGVHSIGSQQQCPEDTRAALGRGLHGEELRPPANSHVSGSREQILLPQIRHPMPAAPLNISTAPHDRPGARLTQLFAPRFPILRSHVR